MHGKIISFQENKHACRKMVLMFSLALFFVGCNNRSLSALLDRADNLMIENPQQAYCLLDSIDPGSFWSGKNKARYSLLYSEALYKNYMPIEDDSLIMTSVRYYSGHKNQELLFRSYYCLGCIYSQLECYTDAAVAFSQAEMLLDYVESNFRKGQLYMQMGTVFFNSFDFYRAEPCFLKAADFFSDLSNNIYYASALGNLGMCKMQLGYYKEAIIIFDDAIDRALSLDNTVFLSNYLLNKMTCLIMDGDSQGALSSIEEYLASYGIPESDSRSLCMIARGYLLNHDRLSARSYLDKAWSAPAPVDSINLYYVESQYQEQLGHPDSALALYRKSISGQNHVIGNLLDQPVLGAQRDYYRAISELASVKARNKTIVLTSAIIILLLIVITLFIYSRYRKQVAENNIRKCEHTIKELELHGEFCKKRIYGLNVKLKNKASTERMDKDTISNLEKRVFELSNGVAEGDPVIRTLNLKVREMFRKQFQQADFFYTRFYDLLNDKRKTELFYSDVKSQIEDFTCPRSLARLDEILNESLGDIMDKLSSLEPELNDSELLLIRFVLAGFSSKSTALFLNDTHLNVRQRKKRLLGKIEKSSSDLYHEIDNILNYSQV